jgi:hypothetical protein
LRRRFAYSSVAPFEERLFNNRLQPGHNPQPLLKHCVAWVRYSRMAPSNRLCATVRQYLPGILNSFRLRVSNATA